MAAFSVLLFIAMPAALISVTVSLWRFRRTYVKVLVLVAHLIASALLIAFVSVGLPLLVVVLSPGMLIALLRLGTVVVDRVKES